MIVRISCSTRTRQASQRCSNVRVVFDPFWMTDANNFSNPSKFNRSIRLIEDELNHTKEDFINHFKETYTNQYPPSWMLTEILPFSLPDNNVIVFAMQLPRMPQHPPKHDDDWLNRIRNVRQ